MFYGLDELKILKEGNDKNFDYGIPKVFISLPMSGIEEKYIKMRMGQIFQKFCDFIGNERCYLIDSYTKTIPLDTHSDRVYCLGDSINLMSFADMVIFAKDYSEATGCHAEFDICRAYPEMNYTFEDFLEGGLINGK